MVDSSINISDYLRNVIGVIFVMGKVSILGNEVLYMVDYLQC